MRNSNLDLQKASKNLSLKQAISCTLQGWRGSQNHHQKNIALWKAGSFTFLYSLGHKGTLLAEIGSLHDNFDIYYFIFFKCCHNCYFTSDTRYQLLLSPLTTAKYKKKLCGSTKIIKSEALGPRGLPTDGQAFIPLQLTCLQSFTFLFCPKWK